MKTPRSITIHNSLPTTSLNANRAPKFFSKLFHNLPGRKPYHQLDNSADDVVYEKALYQPIVKVQATYAPKEKFLGDNLFGLVREEVGRENGFKDAGGYGGERVRVTGLRRPVRKVEEEEEEEVVWTFEERPRGLRRPGLRRDGRSWE
ncbi:hypothetical protein M7I_3112 [Glarea lozoyensis 74030]|uniref:Uncharacterized protein n=1 Tax=Glarea lozoyensis (strain ATCC 74030 / MF5533) TaxID=1104152 RepID=H0EKL3_GLAL7|nr:hypothetical protein M7I_3112 [Glarea lozoyensis 74030]